MGSNTSKNDSDGRNPNARSLRAAISAVAASLGVVLAPSTESLAQTTTGDPGNLTVHANKPTTTPASTGKKATATIKLTTPPVPKPPHPPPPPQIK